MSKSNVVTSGPAEYDRHGKIITHGRYKGHLTKAGKLWNSLQHGKKYNTVTSELARSIANSKPLDVAETRELKSQGYKVRNGFVVSEREEAFEEKYLFIRGR